MSSLVPHFYVAGVYLTVGCAPIFLLGESLFFGGGGVTVWRDSFIKGVVEVEVGIRKPEVGWVSDCPVFLGRRKEVRNFCKNKWTWYIY